MLRWILASCTAWLMSAHGTQLVAQASDATTTFFPVDPSRVKLPPVLPSAAVTTHVAPCAVLSPVHVVSNLVVALLLVLYVVSTAWARTQWWSRRLHRRRLSLRCT